MDNPTNNVIKERNCPICGKLFIIPVENTYKLIVNKVTKHYCRYTCYRKAQKELEEKKLRKKRSY